MKLSLLKTRLKKHISGPQADKPWFSSVFTASPVHSPVMDVLDTYVNSLKGDEDRDLSYIEQYKIAEIYFKRNKESESKDDADYIHGIIIELWGEHAAHIFSNLNRLKEKGLFNKECYSVLLAREASHEKIHDCTTFLIELKDRDLINNETIAFVRTTAIGLQEAARSRLLHYFDGLDDAGCFGKNMIDAANIIIPGCSEASFTILRTIISILNCLEHAGILNSETAKIVVDLSSDQLPEINSALCLMASGDLLNEDIVLKFRGLSGCNFESFAKAMLLLKQAGIYKPETLRILFNECRRIDDLLNAFKLLYIDGLLTESLVLRFCSHISDHESFARALIILEDDDLSADACINKLQKSYKPLEVVKLILFLQQASFISREHAGFLEHFECREPECQLEIFRHLRSANLLTRENVAAIQSEPELHVLKRWLEKLQHAGLLTQPNMEIALTRPDAGFVIQKLIEIKRRSQDQTGTGPGNPFLSHSFIVNSSRPVGENHGNIRHPEPGK